MEYQRQEVSMEQHKELKKDVCKIKKKMVCSNPLKEIFSDECRPCE